MSDRIHTGSPLPWSYKQDCNPTYEQESYELRDANGLLVGRVFDERDAFVICRAVNGFIPMREFVAQCRFAGRDALELLKEDAYRLYKDV